MRKKSVHPPAHILLLFVLLLLLLFSGQQAENVKKPGPGVTPKVPGFSQVFSGITPRTLDAGDRRGFLPALLFSWPYVSYCCWGAPLLFCCY